MFFFPYRSDRRLQHVPWMNVLLILANTLVFLYTSQGAAGAIFSAKYRLDPLEPRVIQFITYQFLHEGPLHLIGNMVFLWVFGNSVEDRLGKLGYLAFYLAGGVMAGLGHALIDNHPVLGASGAVCAITGAYLALFPLSNISIFYWIFVYFNVFEIASVWLILIQFGENLFIGVWGGGNVAYLAHISGYTFGFAVGMCLLWSRLLVREPYDLLSMYTQHRRRKEFRNLTRRGYRPWELDRNASAPGALAGDARTNPQLEQIQALRSQVSQALNTQQLDQAAELYTRLLDLDATQVLGRQQQLDVANQLLAMQRHEMAARAYELFLNTFRSDPQRQEIELLLGLLYTRYLGRRQRARELLSSAVPRLHNADQRSLAEQLLAEIGAY